MITIQDKIRHLYLRSGFGLSPKEWESAQTLTLQQAINQIFQKAENVKKLSPDFQDRTIREIKNLSKEERKALLKKERQLVLRQNSDWVARMANPECSALLEKMCLFWHGHFACITKGSKLAHQQLQTIRNHALGNFRSFVHAMAKDVAMIRFLNNQQNRKSQPNENFARELMELFTIGRGNYTEQDIKEAARAFTGWSSDLRGAFKFKRFHHDFGPKTFMGKTGNFNGEDIIDIILNRPETAFFITKKIYRYFVNDQVDEEQLKLLSKRFYESDYDIRDLMNAIFSSSWFYDAKHIGVKIKSPIELIAGVMRIFEVKFEDIQSVVFIEKAMGQVLFNPPNVAGWAGGKNWIDNSTLMLRLNLVAYLFKAVEVDFKVKAAFEDQKRNKAIRKIHASIDLQPLLDRYRTEKESRIFTALSNYLMATSLTLDLKTMSPFLVKNNKEDFIKTLVLRLMSLPEYQMC